MDEPNRLGARPETRPASPAHSEAKSSEGRQAGVARRSPAELAERALEGEQSAGARLIRLLENQERDGIEGFAGMAEAIEFVVHASAENPETNTVMNERTDRFKIGERWVEARVMGVFELRDGKISSWRDYFDLAEFQSQMAG